MYRVFCATPSDSESDLENERQEFYKVVGQLNETEAMPAGILFVPVSVLPNLTNMTVFRPSIDENVRACRFFVQVLEHTWGPPTRDFEHTYQLATECCTGIALFFKAPNGRPIEPRVSSLKESLSTAQNLPVTDFEGLEDFSAHLRSQLSTWLRSIEIS